ncbi:MAG: phosphotransferase [Acidimicrobiales bacterium]
MLSTTAIVQCLMPGSEIRAVNRLRSSERTIVERVHLVRPGTDDPERVVTKRFLQATGFAAEAGALSVMPAQVLAPQLLAEDPIERFIVMTDIGSGPSLADALLGDRTDTAESALGAWAETMAGIHRATTGLRRSFSSAVVGRGGSEADVDPMARWLAATPTAIDGTDIGLAVPAGLHEELTSMIAILDDPAWGALSQGDACPDNNIITRAGLHLVDFEEAAFRHVAWDLAYLRVPWPSCWCAWNLPAAAPEAATAHYLRALNGSAASTGRSPLEGAMEVATLAFALIAAAWFLPSALRRDDTLGTPEQHAPSRRAAVLHRFALAADTATKLDYHSTAAATRTWVDTLQQRWGARILPTTPALR